MAGSPSWPKRLRQFPLETGGGLCSVVTLLSIGTSELKRIAEGLAAQESLDAN